MTALPPIIQPDSRCLETRKPTAQTPAGTRPGAARVRWSHAPDWQSLAQRARTLLVDLAETIIASAVASGRARSFDVSLRSHRSGLFLEVAERGETAFGGSAAACIGELSHLEAVLEQADGILGVHEVAEAPGETRLVWSVILPRSPLLSQTLESVRPNGDYSPSAMSSSVARSRRIT